ncbi:PREDICTED: nucleolar protein 14 [Lupinus angustifolius]|uniref:nucleolar protein 14 n=1 Tax=Lupinus angustifolius TaxID=3871 RepID=UPI00092FCDE5|nr:PREDICTED: nucleolar protein 14 [Lupinus angustifolius]
MAKSSKRSTTAGAAANNQNTNKKKNNKKKNKSAPDAVAMKVKGASKTDNPFESIWSRRKFQVLGQKRKGESRRLGLARSVAIEKRKNTLLKEYEQSAKSSVFVDKRIGEKDEGLDEFGKAILRSQRERQLNMKLSKKSKYHLSDGEEDFEDVLGRDDFEDEMLPDNDDDAVETEKRSDFGTWTPGETSAVEGEGNKHKTKKEVMEEIIAKSKFYKAQKAKDKEENEDLVKKLDENFTEIVESKALLSLTEPNKMKALKALVNKHVSNEQSNKDNLFGSRTTNHFPEDKPDDYDKLVKQMGLEMRARPSDRTKTPEEIAQEERERLEELEEERQKRMTAAEDSSDEDEDLEKTSKQKPMSLSGDDLGDSFSVNEETMTKKGWIDKILERKDEEESSSEDGEDDEGDDLESSEDADEGSDEDLNEPEKDLSLKDWEQSDDDYIRTESEDEEDNDEGKERAAEELDEKKRSDDGIQKKAKKNDNVESRKGDKDSLDAKKTSVGGTQSKELDIPYIIEAPKTFEELCSLLDNCSNSDTILIINRIRKSNPITLAVENRKKIQVFYGVLLQYFAVLANKKPLNVELLNVLVKPLIEISTEIPYFSAICARRRIETTRKQFVESIKNSESSSWPSSKTLFLLRLWSMIYPCSDFRHPVMTPVILLMCEYLMRCPIVSGRDIAIGSILCSMLLSIFRQSRKFCPEAIMFLQTSLMAAIESSKHISHEDSPLYHLVELKALKPLLCIHEAVHEISPLNFFKIIDMPEDSSFFASDNFRASVLVTVVETLQGYITVYEGLSSFPEIFSPILRLLLEIAGNENIPNALRDKIKDVAELVRLKVDEHHTLRRPLQMRKRKPVPIRLLNPKFEENYVKGRDYDPDRERAEMRKLKRELKREAKGAARELRKDNYFLLEVKDKERSLLEKERAEKYGRAKAFLQEQEHAFKSGQLGKGRKRKN